MCVHGKSARHPPRSNLFFKRIAIVWYYYSFYLICIYPARIHLTISFQGRPVIHCLEAVSVKNVKTDHWLIWDVSFGSSDPSCRILCFKAIYKKNQIRTGAEHFHCNTSRQFSYNKSKQGQTGHMLPGLFYIFVSLQWSILQVLIFSHRSSKRNICRLTSATSSSCLRLFISSSSICPPGLRPPPCTSSQPNSQEHKKEHQKNWGRGGGGGVSGR